MITSALICAVFSIGLIIAMVAATSSRAWASIKNGSGKELLLAPNAFEVWRTARQFTPADCKTLSSQVIAQRVGLPADEVSTACGWFGNSDLQPFIAKSVRQQLLGYGFPAYQWLTAIVAAMDMSKRLAQRASAQPDEAVQRPTLDEAVE